VISTWRKFIYKRWLDTKQRWARSQTRIGADP